MIMNQRRGHGKIRSRFLEITVNDSAKVPDQQYHAIRARQEFDASRRAKSEFAANLHLRLARLHEQQATGC